MTDRWRTGRLGPWPSDVASPCPRRSKSLLGRAMSGARVHPNRVICGVPSGGMVGGFSDDARYEERLMGELTRRELLVTGTGATAAAAAGRRSWVRYWSALARAGGIGHAMGRMSRVTPRNSAITSTRARRAGCDRRILLSGTVRQGVHACGEEPREGNRRWRRAAREGIGRAARLAVSRPRAFAPSWLAGRCERPAVPSTTHGELLRQVAVSLGRISRSGVQVLVGKAHAQQAGIGDGPGAYREGG